MTTIRHEQATVNPLPLLALIALAIAVASALLAIQVRPRTHAVQKHGREALAIRDSCENKGPVEVWRSLSPSQPGKFFQVCELSDGRLGLRIIQCTAKGWLEKTAFVAKGALGNGTWERTIEYLSARAAPFEGKLSRMCN